MILVESNHFGQIIVVRKDAMRKALSAGTPSRHARDTGQMMPVKLYWSNYTGQIIYWSHYTGQTVISHTGAEGAAPKTRPKAPKQRRDQRPHVAVSHGHGHGCSHGRNVT